MNVVRRTLWAMAWIHEHIDFLPISSTLFEIYWQNLDQRHTETNGYRHASLRKWIFERAQDDMCTHTCDFAIVCCATVTPQAWTGTWGQLHCDTHLAHVYEESLEFRYPCVVVEVQNCNVWMLILLWSTTHVHNAFAIFVSSIRNLLTESWSMTYWSKCL